MSRNPRLRSLTVAAALAVLAPATSLVALAQEHGGGGPDPQEVLKRVIEIEHLMKDAEKALARSTDANAARTAEDRIEKLLDEKAQAQAGKSAEQLRKDASGGSAEATETLRRLLEESKTEANAATKSVEKLLDEKARSQTGKSSEELRKLAEGGSKDAQEQLRRLTESAQQEAAGASYSIHDGRVRTQEGLRFAP